MKRTVNINILVESIGEDGTVAFIYLLRGFMPERSTGDYPTQQDTLQFPTGTFKSGYRTPAQSKHRSQSTSLIEKSSIRFSQKVVTKAEFYGSRKARKNDIMLESDESIPLMMKNTNFPVWLVRGKAFVRIPDILRQSLKESDGVSCRLPSIAVKSEFYLVQFFDIISSCHLSVDTVDRTLR